MGVDLVLYKISKGDTVLCDDEGIDLYKPYKDIMDKTTHTKQTFKTIDTAKVGEILDLDPTLLAPVRVSDDGILFSDGEVVKCLNHKDTESCTISTEKMVWCVDIDEIAYQRDGLNEEGYQILAQIPHNTYIFDATLLKELVEKGDLDQEFVNKWVDHDTAFKWNYSGWGA